MSKISNYGLTRSGRHRTLYNCTRMTTVGVKWLTSKLYTVTRTCSNQITQVFDKLYFTMAW